MKAYNKHTRTAKPENRATQQEIVKALQIWYTTTLNAMEKHIPKSKTKTEQKPVLNTTVNNIRTVVPKNLRKAT